MKQTHKLDNEQKIEIVEKYKTGKYTLIQLGNEYNVSSVAIAYQLKKNNISINNDQSKLHTKYSLNQNYFDIIDTEDKAYFLGLLYADGCNEDKRNNISLSLQEEDKQILEKFKSYINSNRPLDLRTFKHQINWKNQYRLNITNKHISKILCIKGCTPKKSLTLKFPTEEQVPKHLINHFLRGMWDGDGCVYSYFYENKQYTAFGCNLTSTIYFCESLKILLKLEIDINSYIGRKNNSNITASITIGGNKQVKRFLKWLYKDATVYLERKYLKAIQMIPISNP